MDSILFPGLSANPKKNIPTKSCPACGAHYVAAWGWVLLPTGRVSDLCGVCARTLRYSAGAERREVIASIYQRIGGERRAA
ncbi:MAG: hypothetical protein ACREEM_13015 [Blastocatellia bacterium]